MSTPTTKPWQRSSARSRRASSGGELRLQPSWSAAAVASLWLIAAAASSYWVGSSLVLVKALLAAVVLALGGAALRTCVLLRGPRAIRSLAWNTEGEWWVYTARTRCWEAATPKRSTAQWGARWVWFVAATASGSRAALIDRRAVADEAFARAVWALRAQRSRTEPAGGQEAAKLPRRN